MYNQIPKKFITSGKIEAYLKQNNIAVVHFVREAKVLNYASFMVGIEHTQDKNRAEELHHIGKYRWDENMIDWILKSEKKKQKWDERIVEWNLRGHYVRYEDLIMGEDRCVDNLLRVIAFLQPSLMEGGGDNATPHVNIHSSLLTLHSPTCEERIENYQELAAHPRLVGSRTIATCDMINEYFASVSNQ